MCFKIAEGKEKRIKDNRESKWKYVKASKTLRHYSFQKGKSKKRETEENLRKAIKLMSFPVTNSKLELYNTEKSLTHKTEEGRSLILQ